MKPVVRLALLAVLASACDSENKPMISAENVRVFAPLPGRDASVVYLEIQNRSRSPVSLVGVASAAFARAEIHQTAIENGIARMQSLNTVTIDAESQIELAPGGIHIMLLEPNRSLLPGANVQLEFRFDDGSVLILDAPVLTRMGAASE